jgi:hypothetical protein
MTALHVVWAADAPAPKMTPEEIRAKCAEIDVKCSLIMSNVQELQALKASLLAQLGEGAPPPTAAAKPWNEKVAISGYFQNRFEHFAGTSYSLTAPGHNGPKLEDQFTLRRMYVNLLVHASDNATAVITWSRDGGATLTANWANAYLDYKLSPTETVRFGQASTWFGLDEQQSSSQRLPFERAAFQDGGGRDKPPGLFFGGPYDKGMWWVHNPTAKNYASQPQVILGVVNGAFREAVTAGDNSRTYSADVRFHPSWGTFGVSWLNGDFSQSATAPTYSTVPTGPFARHAFGGFVRYEKPKSWALQSEIGGGVNMGHTFSGWYAQAEKMMVKCPGTFFTRYEEYEPNTDNATNVSDMYKAWLVGYAHNLDANNKVTAQWTLGRRGGMDEDEAGLQWQYGF